MTWSVVMHDAETGAFAAAVATCAFAVGASCPFVRAGIGAVSTQSMTNRYLGPAVLDGMARGLAPDAAIQGVLAGDDGRHLRQVHAVDRHGRTAPGRRPLRGVGAVAAPSRVLAWLAICWPVPMWWGATLQALAGPEPLPERLAAAMLAGEAAGGDRGAASPQPCC